jgi:hypothetical protein
MSSNYKLLSLIALNKKCELLLTKNTVKKNINLKNRVDNLILEIEQALEFISNIEIAIELINSSPYKSDDRKLRETGIKEDQIIQILSDLNNEYIGINNEYQEIKSTPFYKKAYNRFTGQTPALNVPYSSTNMGPILSTPIIDDEFSFNENFLPSAETTAYLPPPLADAYLP